MTLTIKLFTAMFIATFSVVGYLGFIIQWSFDQGFLEYVNTEEQQEINRLAHQLELHYSEHLSWDMIRENPVKMLQLHALTIPDKKLRERVLAFVEGENFPSWMAEDTEKGNRKHPLQRTLFIDGSGNTLFGKKLGSKLPKLIPLMHDNKQVGSLGLYPPTKISDTNQLLFQKKQKEIILIACAAGIFITAGISMLLAYHLSKPIVKLTAAANSLAEGDYSTRVPVVGKGALAKLFRDFNTMAQTLAENEDQRQRWLSDIAHELRTPLTSLKGEIEALQDGIRKPDERSYNSLHQGVTRLERLVEDLYDLTRSEAGMLSMVTEQIDLHDLVSREVYTHRPSAEAAGLTLNMEQPDLPAPVWGDRQRLQQLVDNLLTNSLRYTDRGGQITVAVSVHEKDVVLDINDSAPGVDDASLPYLFDRLYRVEQSRNRALGGAGLGLAISKHIAAAHDGTITAGHSALGGLHMQVTLPLLEMEKI